MHVHRTNNIKTGILKWFAICLALSTVCISANAYSDTAVDWLKKANESLRNAQNVNIYSKELAYQEALEAYDKAIERDPHLMRAWLGKLDMLQVLGKDEMLNKTLEEVVRVNPTSEGWLIRGEMLVETLDFDRALASFDKALELNPDSAKAWWYKGFIIGMHDASTFLHKCNQSIECFDEAIRIDPDYADAWYYKGSLLRNIGKYEEGDIALNKALDLYNKELKSDPKNIDVLKQKDRILKLINQTSGKRSVG